MVEQDSRTSGNGAQVVVETGVATGAAGARFPDSTPPLRNEALIGGPDGTRLRVTLGGGSFSGHGLGEV